MLVTFGCDVYPNTTYFGDVTQTLLKIMGHSGNVPGAILAEGLQSAIEVLKEASAPNTPREWAAEQNDWREKPVTLAHRALPLVELLTAAAKANRNVMRNLK
jgi:hypothetical protein